MTGTALFFVTPPPSTNQLYRNAPGKGRHRTDRYSTWRNDAGWQVREGATLRPDQPKQFNGYVRVCYTIPRSKRKRDLDNYAKALGDLLTEHKIILDDSQIAEIRMRFVPATDRGLVKIAVSEMVGDDA